MNYMAQSFLWNSSWNQTIIKFELWLLFKVQWNYIFVCKFLQKFLSIFFGDILIYNQDAGETLGSSILLVSRTSLHLTRNYVISTQIEHLKY